MRGTGCSTNSDMDLLLKGDVKSSTYSGGNKRKLSVAMSMIANPNVNCPGPPGRLSALTVFHSKIVFVWRFCMGAQGA